MICYMSDRTPYHMKPIVVCFKTTYRVLTLARVPSIGLLAFKDAAITSEASRHACTQTEHKRSPRYLSVLDDLYSKTKNTEELNQACELKEY